jgi:hypothetical protein
MKSNRTINHLTRLSLVVFTAAVVASGQEPGSNIQTQKRAQTGLKYLAVGSFAHLTGMAEATTALEGTAASLFYNPAGIARMQGFAEVGLGTADWIADIKHNSVCMVISPWGGDFGSVGFFFQNVDYGEIQATVRANNDQGYLDIGTFKPGGSAIGIGYAIPLSDRFSVGGTVKLAKQNLGDGILEAIFVPGSDGKDSASTASNSQSFKTDVVAFDFGVLYKTGIKSLAFGMAVRNFSREIKYIREGFQLPLSLRIGLSMNMLDLFDVPASSQALVMAVDAEHPRDYDEQVRVGLEYTFAEMVSLRVGYVTPADGQAVAYGLGVKQSLAGVNLAVDYSYTPFEVFDGVYRLSLRFGF